VEGFRNQGEEFGGEFYAARRFLGEDHAPEQVPERDGASARWEVQVSKPVDGVLRDRRLARKIGPLQVVVKVYVADECGARAAHSSIKSKPKTRAARAACPTSRQMPTAGWSTLEICSASWEGQTE
jgi:hypothetical protein